MSPDSPDSHMKLYCLFTQFTDRPDWRSGLGMVHPKSKEGMGFPKKLRHVDPRWSSGLSRQIRSWMRKVVGSNPGDG